MSTNTFNEADHPRGQGGKWAEKNHSEADVDLAPSPAETMTEDDLERITDELREAWPHAASVTFEADEDGAMTIIDVRDADGDYLGAAEDPDNPSGADEALMRIWEAGDHVDVNAENVTMKDERNGTLTLAGDPAPIPAPRFSDERIEELEDGDELEPEDWKKIDKAIRQLKPWETEFVYVDNQDHFDAEEANLYLAGDPDNELWEKTEDAFADSADDSREAKAAEILREMGWDYPDDEAIRNVSDRLSDTSDPIEDLARNTGPQLMRAPLGESGDFTDGVDAWADTYGYEYNDLYSGNSEHAVEARTEYLNDYLTQAGVDVSSRENQEAVRYLVTNGPHDWHEGVRLDAIFNSNLRDAAVASSGTPRTLDLTDSGNGVNLVLLDPYNGSGMDARLTSTSIPIHVTAERPAVIDSGAPHTGYGWDDAAGVVHSAYTTDITDREE